MGGRLVPHEILKNEFPEIYQEFLPKTPLFRIHFELVTKYGQRKTVEIHKLIFINLVMYKFIEVNFYSFITISFLGFPMS